MTETVADPTKTTSPALIIGAGISGLLVAQYFRKAGIPYRIFERDYDFATRGIGWGLTLQWSLPALKSILADDLIRRLPETYSDRGAVQRGDVSTFPFFDLSTGERKGVAPVAPESERIRVTRDKFRRLLATNINVEVNSASDFIVFRYADDCKTKIVG